MNFVYDLKIGPKLLVNLGVTLAFMLIIVLCALWGIGEYTRGLELGAKITEQTSAVRIMQNSEFREIIAMRGYLLSGQETGLADLEPARRDYQAAHERAMKLADNPEEIALLSQIGRARQNAEARLNEKRALKEKGDMAGIIRIEQTLMPAVLSEFNTPIDTLINKQDQQEAASIKHLAELGTMLQWLLILAGIGSIGLSALVSNLISHSITTPLKRLIATTQAMAKGELPLQVEKSYNDCVGDMADAFGEMVERLRETIGQVRDTASTVAAGSDQIGSATEELSRTAQSQATAAEQTSSSMEEMSASIQQVASNTLSLARNVEETSSSISEMAASITQVAGNANSLGTVVDETSASINQMTASIQQVAGRPTRPPKPRPWRLRAAARP